MNSDDKNDKKVESHHLVDPRFAEYFANLQQVFLYINDQCNLGCKQCIYKPQVTYHDDREIGEATAISLLSVMAGLGAHKLTILGGEPTLYGRRTPNRLAHVIDCARALNYRYIRVDTNGLFPTGQLGELGLARVDEIAFSVDGYDATTHDRLRGLGNFRKTIKQIDEAVRRGIGTSITCCLQKDLYAKDVNGLTGVERVIHLARDLGVDRVNFHDLFKAGVPMDTWTGDYNPTPADHVAMYAELAPRIAAQAFDIDVRLPMGFATREEFAANPEYFGFCPVKLGERVMIHSEGTIRICSNLICSSFGIARWNDDTIVWNDSNSNEALKHELNTMTPCTNRSKNLTYGEYVPLCFSFKPGQDEPSWNAIGWENRRRLPLLGQVKP